ncbi:MAG TPA: hypothetical protein VGD78_02535 [Chthoniobacterales bacterium]
MRNLVNRAPMGCASKTVQGSCLRRAPRVLLAGALALAVFWAATLAVSPRLHEWVHADADHEDHDCAVTLFLSGAVGPAAVAAPPTAPVAEPVADFHYREFSPLSFVGPSARSVLEHGPPSAVSHFFA